MGEQFVHIYFLLFLLSYHFPSVSLSLTPGQSGLGKSTLVNTLFKSQVSRRSTGWSRDEKIPKTVEIKSVSHGKSILIM